MPIARLDGYFVVADLVGVPDLFGRVGPILTSLLPGRPAGPRVRELRRTARVVVTAWVLVAVPVMVARWSSCSGDARQAARSGRRSRTSGTSSCTGSRPSTRRGAPRRPVHGAAAPPARRAGPARRRHRPPSGSFDWSCPAGDTPHPRLAPCGPPFTGGHDVRIEACSCPSDDGGSRQPGNHTAARPGRIPSARPHPRRAPASPHARRSSPSAPPTSPRRRCSGPRHGHRPGAGGGASTPRPGAE